MRRGDDGEEAELAVAAVKVKTEATFLPVLLVVAGAPASWATSSARPGSWRTRGKR